MNAYLYQAELFCADCGEHLRSVLPLPAGANLDDESTWDSDAYPKGPVADGGGEADSPQHCGDCNEFLQNPLTPDGIAYVRKALTIYESTGEGRDLILAQWRDFYGLESHYAEEEDAAEPLDDREAADLAPQWGSFMTDGDPGAIMYSAVPPETAQHRDSMLRYIRGQLYPVADSAVADASERDLRRKAERRALNLAKRDARDLRALAAYLKGLEYVS